jgi:hypothetical protein
MTAWERERWRKLYVREPKDQEIMAWQTRGLRDLLIRIAEDDGRIGRDLGALRRLLRAGGEIDEHVATLLDDGFLEGREGGLYVRNLSDAQDTAGSLRARAARPERSEAPGGRWGNTTPEQRAEAARRAADARWGRRTGDASTHGGDASADASLTHADASSDASGPRAVSGNSDLSESLPEEREEEKREDQTQQRPDASTHSLVTHRRMTHDASTRAPRNLAEALSEPIGERASRVQRDAHMASYLEPHRWPEVQSVSDALCAAMGRPPRVLAGFDRDTGVRAVLALYAAGYDQAQLVKAARLAPKQPWWNREGARRGLSTLTPEVVDRALHDPADERVGAMVRSAREAASRESEPAAVGGLLTSVLATGATRAP